MTNLTKREQEVYKAIINNVEGLSTKELAKSLNIQPSSFNTYTLNIFQKYCVCSRTELIVKHYHALMRKHKLEQGDFYGILE